MQAKYLRLYRLGSTRTAKQELRSKNCEARTAKQEQELEQVLAEELKPEELKPVLVFVLAFSLLLKVKQLRQTVVVLFLPLF